MNDMTSDLLRRAGWLMERARREGKSLHDVPNLANIVLGARHMAHERGASREQINDAEMAGERDQDAVHAQIKVRAVFAYYWDPVPSINQPAVAEYLIRESNHPSLPAGGNVMAETLLENGISLPVTPTYETWVKLGKKAVRS